MTRIPFHVSGKRRVIKHATTGADLNPRVGWKNDNLPCVGADPTLFDVDYDLDGNIDTEKVRQVTVRYCARCPARRDCVIDGMQTDDVDTMRGGLALRLDRYHCRTCIDCGIPSAMARDGDLCAYCSLSRESVGDEL